jgi:hypothetical protein
MLAEIVAAIALIAVQVRDPASSVQLGEIEAKLFYKSTGRLSVNMLARGTDFIAHNSIIGEGSTEEPAEDILVTVDLRMTNPREGDQINVNSPVEIEVRNGSKVAARRVFSHVSILQAGVEKKALCLPTLFAAHTTSQRDTMERSARHS